MDADGDTDLILAEHRGALKLAIWFNGGKGAFTEKVVSTGKESHLGGRTVDLDADGDLDIVSIAWDAPGLLHLWRNDQFRTITLFPILLKSTSRSETATDLEQWIWLKLKNAGLTM
jgi:hypothetical protein